MCLYPDKKIKLFELPFFPYPAFPEIRAFQSFITGKKELRDIIKRKKRISLNINVASNRNSVKALAQIIIKIKN